ncbi:MAG TPA: hypothetical protein V6C89_14075 [Drouetiella sp.]
MTNYNLALVTTDKVFNQKCIELAQTNLQSISNQYLLGIGAQPHVTLCQYTSDVSPEKVWLSVSEYHGARFPVKFDHVYVRPGKGEHAGFYWVGLAIQDNQSTLSRLQQVMSDKLATLGIATETESSSYFPHLTWARCLSEHPIAFTRLPNLDLWSPACDFQLSIGLSNANGVYQRCLRTE